jgi:RNA polymerase sigma factor (sigma-70 family)
MAGTSSREVLRHLNTLFHCGAAGQLSDAELLGRFVAGRDEAAEAAFAALVERHGVMVLGVCRRVLANRDEAEDAFQATFLVLARKAAAIARRELLASWLHGVAHRAALDARTRATRQKAREKRLGAMLPAEPPDQTLANELRAVLDEELARLPERHRTAILLCELEGLSRREAAARLGISEGTLSSRLARAKSRLRDRLTRRGFALSAAALAAVLSQDAHAVILPPLLVDSTIRVATLVAAGSSLAGVVSTSVVTLTEGVLKAMLFAKLKLAVLGVVTMAVVSASVGVLAQDGPDRAFDNDRLKAVERKIDKLLEVMGGSSRRNAPPDAPPSPDPIPRAAVPAPPPTPALAPLAPPPPVTAAPPVAPSVDFALPRWGRNAYPVPEPSPKNVAGRVDLLERRLSELERRFGDLERRVTRSRTRSGLPGSPGLPPSGTGPGVFFVPDTPRVASSPFAETNAANPFELPGAPDPFEESTTAAPHLTPPARSLPSADTAPSIPASEDSLPDSPARPSHVE